MKLYKLMRNYEYTGGMNLFLPDNLSPLEHDLTYLSNRYHGKRFPEGIIKGEFKTFPDDHGRKNFKFDISFNYCGSFMVLSEKGYNALFHILEPRGHFIEIKTDSKRKKFIGYKLTNVLENVLDLSRSVYKKNEKDYYSIEKFVLIKKNISDEYIFQIKETALTIFVTEKFRKLIEDNQLLEIDFSDYTVVPTS